MNKATELEPVTTTLEEYFSSDARHLRHMLMTGAYLGTPEEKESLLKKISDLEAQFSHATIEVLRQNGVVDKGKIMPEWNREYGFLKLQVYKVCGYTKPNNPYKDLW